MPEVAMRCYNTECGKISKNSLPTVSKDLQICVINKVTWNN